MDSDNQHEHEGDSEDPAALSPEEDPDGVVMVDTKQINTISKSITPSAEPRTSQNAAEKPQVAGRLASTSVEHKNAASRQKRSFIDTLNPEQKLAELTDKAPRVVARRLKKIRDWEKQNPGRKMQDDYIQEYLLQNYETDDTEIDLPSSGLRTSEEILQFYNSLKAKNNEFRIAHSIKPSASWMQNDETLEEVLPGSLPKESDSPPRTATVKANETKTLRVNKKATAAAPKSKQTEAKKDPVNNAEYERKKAEALKRLKQLEKERIEMGPDPEMMKQNKDLEREVVQQALLKQVLIDAAQKKKTQDDEKQDKKRSIMVSKDAGPTGGRKLSGQGGESRGSENIFEGMTLEQMEAAIKREEDLRAASDKRKAEAEADKASKSVSDDKDGKPKKKLDPDLFLKVREEADEKERKDKKGRTSKDKRSSSKKPSSASPSSKASKSDRDDDFDFSVFEEEKPLIEYQDFCYGNVRFLDLAGIKPLEDLKDDKEYNEMFGMISNKTWVKMHFTDPEAKSPPPEVVPRKRKKAKQEEVEIVELKPSFTEVVKEKANVDLDKKKVVSYIPRDFMFQRPPRKIVYVDLPMHRKNYGGNWKTIEIDTKKRIKKKKRLPEYILKKKEEPRRALNLVIQKAELSALNKEAHKWTKWNVKPAPEDYFDWMMEGKRPKNNEDESEQPEDPKKWFKSPPKYKPESPNDSLFEEYDFCGYGNRAKAYFLDVTLPREIMLYNSMYSKLDEFFNSVKKPRGSFPGYALPRWLQWPLDKKLPQHDGMPKDTFFWTRGRIGHSLNPKIQRAEFRLDDPLNHNQVEYDALHDEGCRGYFEQENSKDTVYKAKLIDKEGNVFCTQAQQNRYRMFLRDAAWHGQCERALRIKMDSKTTQIIGQRYIRQQEKDWPIQRALWQETIDIGKNNAETRRAAMVEKVEKTKEETKRRIERLQKVKQEKQEVRTKRAKLYPRASMEEKQAIMAQLHETRSMYYQLHQDIASNNRTAYYMKKQLVADEKKRISWQNKLDQMKRQETLKTWAVGVTREERKRRIAQREEQNAIHRKRLPEIMAERKAEVLRLLGIVRKYFWRWVSKVRKVIKEREDQKHLSLFNVHDDLNNMVNKLADEVGFKKLDFVNMLRENFQALLEAARAQKEQEAKEREEKAKLKTLFAPSSSQFTRGKHPGSSTSLLYGSDNTIPKRSAEYQKYKNAMLYEGSATSLSNSESESKNFSESKFEIPLGEELSLSSVEKEEPEAEAETYEDDFEEDVNFGDTETEADDDDEDDD